MFKYVCNQRGQALALTALGIIVVIGMAALAIDVGFMVLTKTELQAAADAGALAGADDLNNASPDTAADTAITYAKKTPGRATDLAAAVVTYNDTAENVKVTVGRIVPTFFARIFGYENNTITATATAAVFAAGSIPDAPPFVIQAPTNIKWQGKNNQRSQQYTMRITPSSSTDFTYADVVFKKPTSYDEYYDLLKYGYQKQCTMNTQLYYIAPAEGGQTSVDSFNQRTKDDKNSNVEKAKVGDPRLMLIPLVDKLPTPATNGSDWSYTTNNLKIVGFIGFWLESLTPGTLKNNCYKNFVAKGYFVRVSLPANSPSSFGNKFFGPGQVSLVKDKD